jgi:hypothetical protein
MGIYAKITVAGTISAGDVLKVKGQGRQAKVF